MFKLIKYAFLIVVAVLGATFAYINPGSVTMSYYFGELELPLGILSILLLGVGIVMGLMASIPGYVRMRRDNTQLRRRSQLVGDEINNLRSLPAQDR